MKWYLEALRKYAVLSGRSRRKEFWYFVLFDIIFLTLFKIADFVTDVIVFGLNSDESGVQFASAIYTLLTLIPAIAVTVRRLHDSGKSGMWLFTLLIPPIGLLIILILTLQDSTNSENKYGPNPKFSSI
jgi:uncharacterized membrane protein YhaH (DUF805 family)